ncbi:DUF6794 domain-containing protein [uncultured Croceitalea sp.]|uniref:DUF6794 domain-containing protein n=1 Tax=uncultured Croceitalea sp. TaxID=1798908 RepID=UPI003305CE0A
MKKIIIIYLTLSFLSCKQQEKIPIEINIAFEYFNRNWNSEDIEKIKNITEEFTVPRNVDYGIPAEIKNNLLKANENSETLTKFFDSLGVKHYDDMAGILLISYHKFLNGQDIDLNEQVRSSKAYWKPILECEEKQRKRRREINNVHKISDTINIKMPVSETNSVFDLSCPNLEWDFNPSRDLSVDGIITKKYFKEDSTDLVIKVKILTKNHPLTEIMMEEVNVGHEFEVRLQETAWKIKTTGNNTYSK